MNEDDAREHLIASAKLSAQTAADKLLASAQAEALRLRRAGWGDDEIEDGLKIHLAELSDGWIDRLANSAVNIGFSLGRATAAEDMKGGIAFATYTAILDSCCPKCKALDGQEFALDSDEYEKHMPPNTECEGRDSCRCVYLFVTEGAPNDGK